MEKTIELQPLESFYENTPQTSKQLEPAPTTFGTISNRRNDADKRNCYLYEKKYLDVNCKDFEQPSSQPSQQLHDETDLFFGSMAQCVKKLPPSERAKLRMQIGAMVGAAEIEYYKNNELGDASNDCAVDEKSTTPISNGSNFSRSYEDLYAETKDSIVDSDHRANDTIMYLPWSDNN